jgi:hypothetical protein
LIVLAELRHSAANDATLALPKHVVATKMWLRLGCHGHIGRHGVGLAGATNHKFVVTDLGGVTSVAPDRVNEQAVQYG